MGDPLSTYWQLIGGLSHFLLWTRSPAPSECLCRCEGEKQGLDTCTFVIKEVISFCLESATSQTSTTTSAPSSLPSFNWWWLWLLLIVFCTGFCSGSFAVAVLSGRFRSRPAQAPQAPGVSEAVAVARPRRGIEA